MNIKKFLLATISSFIGNVVSYYLLEELLLKSYLRDAIYSPAGTLEVGSPVLPLLAVLSMSLIMAYMYPKGYEGGAPATEGLRLGILLGLFSGIPFGVFFKVLFPIGYSATLILIAVYMIEITAAGLLVGLVYGRMQADK